MAQRDDFPFIHRLRVRWQEVDAQRVVFNGHYLGYLDVAVSEYWRAVGLPYPDGFVHLGGDLYVRHHTMSYHAPAQLDDWLDIGLRCDSIGTSSVKIGWAVWCDHRLLVTGEAVYVYTDLSTRRPHAVPDAFRHQVRVQGQGDAVTRLTVGSWAEMAALAQPVRRAVFIDEQGVPEAEEWDADDAPALHGVVQNLAGLPLATGRLITQGQAPGQARIGRMAVLRSMRGTGLGRAILVSLMDAARGQGRSTVTLHAQTSARRFYEALGFTVHGEVFDEVGIPHIEMQRAL